MQSSKFKAVSDLNYELNAVKRKAFKCNIYPAFYLIYNALADVGAVRDSLEAIPERHWSLSRSIICIFLTYMKKNKNGENTHPKEKQENRKTTIKTQTK